VAFTLPTLSSFCRLVLLQGLCFAVAIAETAVFWVSAPVKAGDTVLVTGYFPQAQHAALRIADITHAGKDWEAIVSTQGRPAELVKASESSLMFVLPNSPDQEVYGFRLDQPGETPVYGRVNAPEIWWTLSTPQTVGAQRSNEVSEVLVDEAAPAATLRVFGRCLRFASVAAELRSVSKQEQTIPLDVHTENDYTLNARIPPSVDPGQYSLRVFATRGAPGSASSARSIVIRRAPAATLTTLNLLDFGGKPLAGFDNSAALTSAFKKAEAAGGAVVLLPPGGYFFKDAISIPPKVYLRGASPDKTAIYFPDVDPAPDAWVSGKHHFGVSDLTIFCANHKGIVSSDMSGTADLSGHVILSNLRIRGSAFRGHPTNQLMANRRAPGFAGGKGYETVRLSGVDLQVLNCDLLGSFRSLYVFRGHGALIQGNTIQNGFIGWYNFNASDDVIFENNKISGADMLSTGGSYSTWGPPKISQNFYTAENSYSQMIGWDREAFTSDGGGGAYYGKIVRTENDRLMLADTPPLNWEDWQGALVAVIDGRGAGQWRFLKGAQGSECEISSPFQVAPDQTSTITIVPAHVHYIFYRNRFAESGVGIQYYGTAIEHIAEGNEITGAGGMFALSRKYSGGVAPEIGVQFIANTIHAGFNYAAGPNGASTFGPSVIEADSIGPGRTIGLVLRRNNLLGQSAVKIHSQAPEGMRGVLLDGNRFDSGPAAMEIDKNVLPEVLLR
jgi:hypothetical protein